MTALKALARILPQPLRSPVRKVWRSIRGNVEFHVLELLADKTNDAIDVGANCGVYTVVLARQSKACHAFEPNPPMVAATTELVKKSALNNVQVHACALSDRDTTVTFRVPVIDGVESGALATIEDDNQLGGADVRSYVVPCRRLDSFELSPVGLMKIDAEGHETAILEGAHSLIDRDKPAVMIEVEERHKIGSVDYVRRFFEGHGYKGYFLLGRKIVPIAKFDAAVHQNSAAIEADQVLFDAVYVNNFIYAADTKRIARLDELARSGRSL